MQILATTDGSLRSLAILPALAAFAQATDSKVTLLRVMHVGKDVPRRRGVPQYKAAMALSASWRKELRDALAVYLPSARAKVVSLRRGERTADAVIRVADQIRAGMIAMSSQGSDTVRHALFGSVAMRVLGCSSLPVFVAGPAVEIPWRKVRRYKIVGCTDGSAASLEVFSALQPFLAGSRFEMSLLRVYVPAIADRSEREELEACRRQVDHLCRDLPSGLLTKVAVTRKPDLESVHTTILRETQRLGANAIAMSTQGHSAVHHLLAGSTALGVLERSTVPVILSRGPHPVAECD